MDPQNPQNDVDPKVLAAISSAVHNAMAPIAESLKGKATNHMGSTPGAEERSPITGKDASEGSGMDAVRFFKAIHNAKVSGGGKSMADVAKSRGHNRVAKALNMAQFDSGGVLVPDEFMAELIPFLEKASIFRRAGVRTIPFQGSVTMPKQTSSGTAYWGEDMTPIVPSQLGLGSIQLQERELRMLTVIGNRLMEVNSIEADMLVRDDFVRTMGEAEEAAFLRSAGSQSAPRGVRYMTDASHVFAQTAAGPTAPTLAEVKRERAKLRRLLKDAKIPMVAPGFICSPRTEEYLDAITDGNGNSPYSDQLDEGRWGRLPIYVSQHVPDNLTVDSNGSCSELYLVDFAQLIHGVAGSLKVEVFPNGTYEEGAQIRSGISRNQTVIRGLQHCDFQMRHEKAATIVKDLRWGA